MFQIPVFYLDFVAWRLGVDLLRPRTWHSVTRGPAWLLEHVILEVLSNQLRALKARAQTFLSWGVRWATATWQSVARDKLHSCNPFELASAAVLVSCRCAEASTCEAGSASDGVLAKLRCVRTNLHEHRGEPAAECGKLLHPGVLHVRGQGSIVCNLWSLSCMQLLLCRFV